MSLKVNSLLSASLLSIGMLAVSGSAGAATTVIWGDPVPATPEVTCAGVGYEWTVQMGKGQKASFVRHVGAKSWNEPPPAYEPPYTGWTHTSDWVAFELKKDSHVTIQIARQQGVLMSSIATDPVSGSPSVKYTPAGNGLYPAFSVYSGWEETGCEDHRYNTGGATPWAPSLVFADNQPNTQGWSTATWNGPLKAGKYSIAIGGANVSFCAPTDSCYTGRHGYRATITTK
ncbi:MAG: hypothetical protein FJ189_14495 [Gammaproteobacteria bacterium]|nr:hypothetical protein [Gammaproteobacteria bacterium]